MKICRLKIFVLLALTIWISGCTMFGYRPAGLKGWEGCNQGLESLDKAIGDDFNQYIQSLPSKEKDYVGPIWCYKDGTGRHAVNVTILLNGTFREHFVIYGKDNKRVRVISYNNGHYRS